MRFDRAGRDAVRISMHSTSAQAKEYATFKANEPVFGVCSSPPYCSMLGGVYLDAVFRNDRQTLARINKALDAEYANRAGTDVLNEFVGHLSDMGAAVADADDIALRFAVVSGRDTLGQSLNGESGMAASVWQVVWCS